MRRIPRELLRRRIFLGLMAIKPPYVRRGLGLSGERQCGEAADDLVHRIMGPEPSEAVILIPSALGGYHDPRPGRWGEDEPYPAPAVPLAEH